MTTLIQHLLEKNPAVVDEARAAGPAAAGALFQQLTHADWEVRELALYCLDAAGGDGATMAFSARLLDPNSQVRAAALEGLRHRGGPGDRDALLRAWDNGAEASVRKEIALLVGAFAATGDTLTELTRRCAHESDAAALEGCLVARAKLGDEGAQRDFVARLQGAQGRAREPWLAYAGYIGARWLLAPLAPLLDDTTDLVFAGVDGRPELTQYLRTCDLVGNLVAAISGRRFSFEVRGREHPTNYTDANLDEVRRYLRSAQ